MRDKEAAAVQAEPELQRTKVDAKSNRPIYRVGAVGKIEGGLIGMEGNKSEFDRRGNAPPQAGLLGPLPCSGSSSGAALRGPEEGGRWDSGVLTAELYRKEERCTHTGR